MRAQQVLWVLVVVLSLGACAPAPAETNGDSGTRAVYGLTLDPSGFDPHVNQSAEIGIVLRQVYDTLVYRHPDTREFVPGLASAWSISEDGLRYTFTLRTGVTFHDGTAFNAQAVAANLDRIMNANPPSERARFLLGPYAGYQVADAQTITIALTEPYSPLLDGLSQPYLGIASPTALNAYSQQRYQFHQVGTGPYRWVDFVPGQHVILERNPTYAWGPAFYAAPAAPLDTLEFRFYVDPGTRATFVEGGEADVMGELLPADARALTANSSLSLQQTAIPGLPLQFLMNTQRHPTDNRAVRQALLYGTNRAAIVDAVFQGFSPVAWGPLSSTTLYYDRTLNGTYAYDLQQARALLQDAGYTDADNNGYFDDEGGDLTVVIVTPPYGLAPQTTELLLDQWRTIGLRVVIEPVPTFPALREAATAGEYNLIAFNAFGLDPAPLLRQFYASDGSTNWTGYGNAELDALLATATATTNDGERAAAYAQVQRQIMDEALVLPIRDYVNVNAVRTRLNALTFDAYGWFPLLANAGLREG